MTIHFIGIGGIGVSALAKYYLQKGYAVSGSDLAETEITQQMKKMGAKVHIGKPKASLITPKTQKVIFSPAVGKNHAERVAARKKGIEELSYPQALGELTRQHFTIAVSGTHGKSTTSSMLGILLTKSGFDPTVIVGTKLKEFGDSTPPLGTGAGSNCRVGKSKYLVIEADEHFASFLNYTPHIAVLTSLEADHMDFYKTLANLKKTFAKYVSLVPQDGWIVANKDDKNIRGIVQGKKNVVWYSLSQKEAKTLAATMQVPGKHNIGNALAALAVARILRIPTKQGLRTLGEYKGSWRRFEIFPAFVKTSAGKQLKYTLVSDYGHHPTEIAATIQAAREKWSKKKIWLVYQPHQYHRTFLLFKDFVKVFSRLPIQKLIITDIYDVAGREEGGVRKKVSSQKLVEKIQTMQKQNPEGPREVLHIPQIKKVETYLQTNLTGGEVVVVMGAGDIYALTLQLQKGKIH